MFGIGNNRRVILLAVVLCPGVLTLALAALPAWTLPSRPAQVAQVAAARDVRVLPDANSKLAFSEDGQLLHAIGTTRAITYSADTGAVASIVNLPPDAEVWSVTSDGGTALLGIRVAEVNIHLALFETGAGRLQDIPSGWYKPEDSDPTAELSGDGNLVSIYDESGADDGPMTVTVYDWATKTLVVKRTSEFISAGGSFGGGVTPDGAIEFSNNRVGRKIVDLKTGRLLGRFGFLSVRSPDGAWVVEFPDRDWDESAPLDVLVKDGRTGETRGKLDAQVADDEAHNYGAFDGAFCGTTGRFILARGQRVAIYAIPSGKLLTGFPDESWRDANAGDTDRVAVACSSKGAHVAILSGTRLTFHDLR